MRQVETFKIRALLENVPVATDRVSRVARQAGFDEPAVYQIQLAMDEACANIVQHAYRGMDPGDMEVSCYLDEQALSIRLRDWGRSFSPDDVANPDLEAPLEERTLGGLGLFLIKQVMDQVHYTFDPEQGNELILVKRLQFAA
jgi:serine/threonine-protein kinase RsbW